MNLLSLWNRHRTPTAGSRGLLAAAALVLAASACAAPSLGDRAASSGAVASSSAASGRKSMESILRSPPTFTWPESRIEVERQYLYVPARGRDPSFYVSTDSFHYLDPEDRLLRYEKKGDGFSLIEIRKRRGIAYTPDCPVVILPLLSCTEQHYLMLAYVIECNGSCRYRATVFDSYQPIRILPNDPALMQIMRYLTSSSDILKGGVVTVAHEEHGIVDGGKESWRQFLEDRMAFIYDTVSRTPEIILRAAR